MHPATELLVAVVVAVNNISRMYLWYNFYITYMIAVEPAWYQWIVNRGRGRWGDEE